MLRAPILLEELMADLKARKIPFKVQDKVKELYEVAWREAFKEGQDELLNPEKDENDEEL